MTAAPQPFLLYSCQKAARTDNDDSLFTFLCNGNIYLNKLQNIFFKKDFILLDVDRPLTLF